MQVERWGPFGRSWSIDQYSAELIAPQYARLAVMPLAWSASTPGPVTSEPMLTPLNVSFAEGPKKIAANFEAYKKQWSGKLRGRIILIGPDKPKPPLEKPLFRRNSDAELADIAKAPEPVALSPIGKLEDLEWPDKPEEVFRMFTAMPPSIFDQLIERVDALAVERSRFFVAEGVAAILLADERAREGLLAAEAAGSHRARDPLAPPTFVVTAEHYGRLVRLLDQKQPVRLRVDLKVSASEKDVEGGNIVGEIPGGAKRDEIVMVGAHFDSWHSATGTTDNGVGSAVMIEVMRIVKVLNLGSIEPSGSRCGAVKNKACSGRAHT